MKTALSGSKGLIKRKIRLAVSWALLCGVFMTFVFWMEVLDGLELKTLDYRFRHFAQTTTPNKDVVLVAIDDKSLEEFRQEGVVWKWPRDFYAALVRYLQRGGARLILFDILFNDEDIDRLTTYGKETDGAFAEAMQRAGNVILAAHMRTDENLLGGDNPLIQRPTVVVVPREAEENLEAFFNPLLPLPLFQRSSLALGNVTYYDDPDGMCRRLPLLSSYRHSPFPQISLAAYLAITGTDTVQIVSDDSMKIGDVNVPLDGHGNFIVRWYGKGGPEGSFPYYSIGALMASARQEEMKKKPLLPSTHFKDKIVVVGANAAGLFDLRTTPFTAYEPYPAMEIHATVLSNLLERDFIVRAERHIIIIAIFLLCVLTSATVFLIPRMWIIFLVVIACAVGWAYMTIDAFRTQGVWMDIVVPEISLLLSFAVSSFVSYHAEWKARRDLRSIFSRYVSPLILSEIIEQSDKIELSGKELTGTVYFSDLKNFTTMTERMSAREVVDLLNEYFSFTTDIILTRGGFFDKYLGDGIMAVFGAPLADKDHALKACTAALEVQLVLKQVQMAERKGKPALEARIGINSGPMVVGNIGSFHRVDYTAVGDTVNLASRLEGVNKIFRTDIVISEATYNEVKDAFVTRELDILRVKGREQPVGVYELVGKPEDVSPEVRETIEKFGEGLRWYREGAFERALRVFEKVVASRPHDGPSLEYMSRCNTYLSSPPPKEWNGIFQLDTK